MRLSVLEGEDAADAAEEEDRVKLSKMLSKILKDNSSGGGQVDISLGITMDEEANFAEQMNSKRKEKGFEGAMIRQEMDTK